MSGFTLRGRVVAFLLVALALCICAPVPVFATANGKGDCNNGDDGSQYNGPVYLILSHAATFDKVGVSDCDCDECDCGDYDYPALASAYSGCYYCDCEQRPGSLTYIVKIGTYVAAEAIGGTRYEPKSDPNAVDPSNGLDALYGNELTILGAFDTHSPNTVHLVSPDDPDNPMPRKVQEAFFVASPELELMDQFPEPTTVEIAQFIYDTAIVSTLPAPGPVPGNDNPDMGDWLQYDHTEGGTSADPEAEPSLTMEVILGNIFLTDVALDAPDEGEVFAEADGDLFPHEPQDGPLFGFSLQIDSGDGEVSADFCLTVGVDIKPGNADNVVNHKSKGVVWVAILSTDGFDASEDVVWDTVQLKAADAEDYAEPLDYKTKDANKDGYDDMVLKFNVADIGLTKDSTEVELTGELADDKGCLEGTDLVTTVPPKGKSKK